MQEPDGCSEKAHVLLDGKEFAPRRRLFPVSHLQPLMASLSLSLVGKVVFGLGAWGLSSYLLPAYDAPPYLIAHTARRQ